LVAVRDEVEPWAFAGAAINEMGSTSAPKRAAQRRVRADKPDVDRRVFTHNLSNRCAKQVDHHIRQN
jgi:hypothetical protein